LFFCGTFTGAHEKSALSYKKVRISDAVSAALVVVQSAHEKWRRMRSSFYFFTDKSSLPLLCVQRIRKPRHAAGRYFCGTGSFKQKSGRSRIFV